MIKEILFFLLAIISISNVFSLDCTPEGRILEVEISLDDNSFTNDFDGTSGIIQKLTYNPSTNKYHLWQTPNLPTRTDKGLVTQENPSYTSLDYELDSSTATNNNMLVIDTLNYNKIYVKTRGKNSGSCEDFTLRDDHKSWFTALYNMGGSTLSPTQTFFKDYVAQKTLDPNEEAEWINEQSIYNFYSGKFSIATSWRSLVPSELYQVFYISTYLEGRTFVKPSVSVISGSETHQPLVENQKYNIKYLIENNDMTNPYNVSYKFRARTYLNPYYTSGSVSQNDSSEQFILSPGESKTISIDYSAPEESEMHSVNYFSRWFQAYINDPFMGRILLSYLWIPVGNYYHEYLTPYFPTNIVFGTTNDGIPYIGGKYQLIEWGFLHPKSISPNVFDENITVFKNNGSGWTNEFERLRTVSEAFAENEKKDYDFKYELLDFTKWHNSDAKIWIESIWKPKNWVQFRERSDRAGYILDVDFMHLLMSTDLPLKIYPNGGSNEAYIRDVVFNLKDYRLKNVSIETKIKEPASGSSSSYFVITNPNNFDVPAQASYPVPIKIKYTGPALDDRYIVEINYSYFDEINNQNFSKIVYGDLFIENNAISNNYFDIVPVRINFDNLYLNKQSTITVDLQNQGNSNLASSYEVALYYKNMTETSFHLIDEKSVGPLENEVSFLFTPTVTGTHIIKAVVDTNNNINEISPANLLGEENNELASINLIRDIDLVLDYAIPLYDNITKQGIIPFEISVYNKGIGGVDDFEIDLNISWGSDSWYFNESFDNIPEKGRKFIYEWNVTDVTPGVHKYMARAIPDYDSHYSNNIYEGGMDFCPLPWYNDILECFSVCDSSCLDPINKRYNGECHEVNGCFFYNESFAKSCDSYTKDSFVSFNVTHEALCPDARILQLKKITDDKLNITGDCENIIVNKKNFYFRGQSVLMNIIECIN